MKNNQVGLGEPVRSIDDSAVPDLAVADRLPSAQPLAAGSLAASLPSRHPDTEPDESERRVTQRVPMTRLRARIAERLVQSRSTSAILTTFNEVNMQALISLRLRHKDWFKREHGVSLGFMPFFVKAVVHALKKYPVLNASVDGSDIVYHHYYDIGIAVGTPRGLVVPVLRDVDQLSIADIERKVQDFAVRAKNGKLRPDELTGGTFSISNGGIYGSLLSTPILNPPQSAILGVHATKERPIAENGEMVIRPMNYFALSYDHRIIDGQEAALGLVAVRDALENPSSVFEEIANIALEDDDLLVRPAPRAPAPALVPFQGTGQPLPNGRNPEDRACPVDARWGEAIRATLANALRVAPDAIDPDAQFIDLGLDSMAAVDWIEQLAATLGLSIMPTMVYAHPTLRQFSEFIASQMHGKRRNGAPAGGASEAAGQRPARRDDKEKVAIIGMSGRYPDAPTLSHYWENLKAGRNSIREVPRTRWDTDRLYDPRPFQDGKTSSKWLGMLDDVDQFDPLFFGISPASAELIDPQQRIFLQEAYKAFEDAGYAPASLKNTECGVYLGLCNNDYSLVQRSVPAGLADRLGNSGALASARIAYHLSLKGPALTIDTACSSSLVAMHTAVLALLSGEIDLALAGGVSLYLTPEWYVCMSAAGVLSPDGQCKTFDRKANGFVPGEGVGAVVLKRLSDAERDGDNILGVLVGTGINQDGKTNGITAPSMVRQTELFRRIYARNDIDARSITYVEAHGTGTKLGDPIELEALAQAFRADSDEPGFCALGSVKSNIGHTTAAAGLAGVHKVLLSMRNRQLPPAVNFSEPNEHFDFERSPFFVNTVLRDWQPPSGVPRRAAVSSFGISGTNSHVVIEEPPVGDDERVSRPRQEPVLVVLSAKTQAQLAEYAALLDAHVGQHDGIDLQRLAFTLQAGRDPMDFRLAVFASSVAELRSKLRGFVEGQPEPGALFPNDAWGSAAREWLEGRNVDWLRFYGDRRPRRISLPTYPFARERCWTLGQDGPNRPQQERSVTGDEARPAPVPAPPSGRHPQFDEDFYGQLFDQLIEGAISLDAAVERTTSSVK